MLGNSILLLAKLGRKLWTQVLAILERTRYTIHTAILDSAEQGAIPQHRIRVYVIGIHPDAPKQDFAFPGKNPVMKVEDLLAPRTEHDNPDIRPPSRMAKMAVDAAWDKHRRQIEQNPD